MWNLLAISEWKLFQNNAKHLTDSARGDVYIYIYIYIYIHIHGLQKNDLSHEIFLFFFFFFTYFLNANHFTGIARGEINRLRAQPFIATTNNYLLIIIRCFLQRETLLFWCNMAFTWKAIYCFKLIVNVITLTPQKEDLFRLTLRHNWCIKIKPALDLMLFPLTNILIILAH